MRYKTITSFSLIAVALLATACSRNKAVAGSPTPVTSADRASMEAANLEAAKLREDADRAAAAQRADAERGAKSRDEIKSTLTMPVHFEFDRSDITDQGLQLLDAKVEALQSNTSIRIRIEGNADDSGSDEYNLVLSQKRAAIVTRYLTDRGIDASRIQIVSYGEEHPVCKTSEDEACRSQNRRDEFVIVSGL